MNDIEFYIDTAKEAYRANSDRKLSVALGLIGGAALHCLMITLWYALPISPEFLKSKPCWSCPTGAAKAKQKKPMAKFLRKYHSVRQSRPLR